MPSDQKELRCFCRREPLLATYGVDRDGQLFIHIRVYKQSRIYGEIFATVGKVKICCRECLRWHKVTIKDPGVATLEEVSSPLSSASSDGSVVLVDD